jgi:hypothetical protein
MLIDCDTCTVRGDACGGCVVNLLFGQAPPLDDQGPGAATGGDEVERRALAVLADAGFEVTVLAQEDSRAPLRLVATRKRGFHAA